MRHHWIAFLFCMMCFSQYGLAETADQIKPIGEITSSPVVLDLKEAPQDATAEYYVRYVETDRLTAWEPVRPDFRQSASKMVLPATHGEKIQIRAAVMQEDSADILTLTDFEKDGSQLVIGFESTRQIFRCDYYIYSIGHIQGKHGLGLRIKKNEDIEVNDKDLLGFTLSDRIPSRDWTNFRYLELYFWSDFPVPFTLLLQGEKELYEIALLQFSEDGEQKEQWHFIRVDLDKVFPKPAERGYMRVCAFTHPIKGLQMGNEYEVRFDALRLWKDDSYIETQIDATPPSAPVGITHQFDGRIMTWTWQPSVDDESGIVGYSYSWSKSSRDNPPDEIMTASPEITFPFSKPPVYSDYHFKVKAKNHAGVWSDTVKESLNFNPKEY